MNNGKKKLLSRSVDGELSALPEVKLREALESDASLKAEEAAYVEIGERRRNLEMPESPSTQKMWQDIRREIRLDAGRATESRALGSRLRWAGGTVAGILVLMMAWVVMESASSGPEVYVDVPAEVEWVETDVPNASTMVYLDDDTGMTVIWLLEQEEGELDAGS